MEPRNPKRDSGRHKHERSEGFMEERAQVNVEYLLIIVGAVAIVTVVALFVKNTANTVTQTGQAQADANK